MTFTVRELLAHALYYNTLNNGVYCESIYMDLNMDKYKMSEDVNSLSKHVTMHS